MGFSRYKFYVDEGKDVFLKGTNRGETKAILQQSGRFHENVVGSYQDILLIKDSTPCVPGPLVIGVIAVEQSIKGRCVNVNSHRR
jgi:hypothetical protein